jgi:predicted alpha-1,2-mannosidase
MMRGRYSGGNWLDSFHADQREPYITEGTPRQYSLYVPHDIPGLIKLMGGKKTFENVLDSLFMKNEYWHGNELGHQIPFLYNYTASPWKTQQQVQKILIEEYSDGPGGLSGNDDAGQMSAWYVFAALGFYPANPVSNEYLLCSPIFDRVKIKLQNRKSFEMVINRPSADAMFIKKLLCDGRPYSKNSITYKNIIEGSKIEICLTGNPTGADRFADFFFWSYVHNIICNILGIVPGMTCCIKNSEIFILFIQGI